MQVAIAIAAFCSMVLLVSLWIPYWQLIAREGLRLPEKKNGIAMLLCASIVSAATISLTW